MTELRHPGQLSEVPGPVVLAIGVFDGLHLGHQAILRRTLEEAHLTGAAPVVATFHPHPTKILRPEAFSRLLTSTPHKLRLLGEMGFRYALVIPFDEAFARTPAGDFIRCLARAARPLEAVVVGCGWRFGHRREGTVDLIREIGNLLGFRALEIPAVTIGGAPVSSTRIREAVREGRLDEARLCLGRPYAILGTVVEGRKLGRTLGFPTANLRAHNEQFPPDGVYAAEAVLDGRRMPAVANVGLRPTLSDSMERTLEVHIPGFSEEIYGRDLEVEFLRFLRPERRFPDMRALAEQIARDIQALDRLEKPVDAPTFAE